MANVSPVKISDTSHSEIYSWTLTDADEGDVLTMEAGFSDRTLIATGTFNAGSYALECSVDGTNFVAAVDAQGDAIALTAVGSVVVGSAAPFWRIVNDDGGSAETIVISLVCVV